MGVLRLEHDRICDREATWARVDGSNLLEASQGDPKMLGPRVVRWSGWFGDETFALDPRTWGPGGWKKFEATCEVLAERAGDSGIPVILRPHARHVLSDAQRCLTFLRRWEGRLGLLLDPVAMLEASMLERAEEHLDRIVEALGEHPGVAGVVVCNAMPGGGDGGGALRPTSIERGVVPRALLERFARGVAPTIPIVVLAEEFERDAGWVERVRG